MRSDKLIGMIRMVSIYGSRYDIIFKYTKYICQGRIHVAHHNPTTNQQMIFMLKLATFSSSKLVIMDLTSWQNIENSK